MEIVRQTANPAKRGEARLFLGKRIAGDVALRQLLVSSPRGMSFIRRDRSLYGFMIERIRGCAARLMVAGV